MYYINIMTLLWHAGVAASTKISLLKSLKFFSLQTCVNLNSYASNNRDHGRSQTVLSDVSFAGISRILQEE